MLKHFWVVSYDAESMGYDSLINSGSDIAKEIFDYIEGDQTVFEWQPMEKLAAEHQLMSYMHRGYWQCMDSMREKDLLDKMLKNGKAPWKVWEE